MKRMKTLVALLLTLVLAIATPALAEEDGYTITIINDAAGHTYEAYQIFTGDLSSQAENDADEGTNAVLSNVVWGDSVVSYNEIAVDNAGCEKASAVAETLESTNLDEFIAKLVLESNPVASTSAHTGEKYVISGLEPGYYLVKDMDNSLSGTAHDAYTEFILEVVENSTVTPKSSVPTVVKKVDDKNDSNATEDAEGWQDSADYDIGDNVPFQLTATLANNVSAYNTYKVVFHDTLSAGLDYNGDAVVTFNNENVTSHFTISEENGVLTISCKDVKEFRAGNGSVITVNYTAKLDTDAAIGSAGNPNTVYLEYSNNPNWVSSGEGGGEEEPTGKTPEDKVIVFTYKVIVNKVDEDGDALEGAEFTLFKCYKTAPNPAVSGTEEGKNENNETIYWVPVEVEKNGAGTVFTFKGLDDGDYKLVETHTPAGYNTIDPIEFTITAEHDVLSDNPALTKLDGGDMFTGEVSPLIDDLTVDVVNNKGVQLPETGGIGTTLFYGIGGVLVLAAVVLLVTKRRMKMHG